MKKDTPNKKTNASSKDIRKYLSLRISSMRMEENPYLAGQQLYGDDFSLDEIKAWFEDEKEEYANLGAKNAASYQYGYHALNKLNGFSHLPDTPFAHVLGFGSAYGDEFEPIADQIEQLTIVEPSDAFVKDRVHSIPTTFVKPTVDGTLPFEEDTFDLITCLDVLHHIPNVTHVLGELYRCLKPGGFALVSEPVISMGDWRHPRYGLTKHERGIPLDLFEDTLAEAGFAVKHKQFWLFPPVRILWGKLGKSPFNSPVATRLDAWLSMLFRWNLQYHATSPVKKLRPTCVYLVLTK